MNVVAIIQARMGSSRLPGKVLKEVEGETLLGHIVRRARMTHGLREVVVATTVERQDDDVVSEAQRLGAPYFRGDASDVLDRYYQAAKAYNADVVVRLTADCPLLDPAVVGRVLRCFLADRRLDYAATGSSYPEGYGTEVFSAGVLGLAWREAGLPSEREHVTPYIWTHPERFQIARVEHSVDVSQFRVTVDEPCDLDVISRVVKELARVNPDFGLEAVVSFLSQHPDIAAINSHIPRLAGYRKSVDDERVH